MVTKQVEFHATKEEHEIIGKIWKRILPTYKRMKIYQEKGAQLDFRMDMVAIHTNDCPIDFQKLLDADEFTFHHDISGIRNNIDRSTGTLRNCFLPRCSK